MRVDAANGAHDLRRAAIIAGSCVAALVLSAAAAAHGIEGKDAAFVAGNSGPQVVPFLYLGAKHMVTGHDHLLFILGVVFFLYRLTHVAIYVTLFSIGHSITLLTGVFNHIDVNPYLVDAVIGLSVAYKAFDNLGGFQTVFGDGEFYHDLHGETHEADPTVVAFKQGLALRANGALVAPMDGVHGWYWQNKGAAPVTVRLKLSGFYELIPPGEVGNKAGILPMDAP